MSDRPPDPGPRPADFEFPFAAASRAVAAIEALMARYRSTAHHHRDAAEDACVGFEGATRELFDAELDAALDDCARAVADLGAQRDQIEGLIRDAQRRSVQREAQIDGWERRRREFESSAATRT